MARITKDPEVRKNELMDFAEQLFIEKGYDHTSASDVIRKAGIAQGTFYYYFESKDEILGAIIDRYFERFTGRVRLIANNDHLDACEKLRRINAARAEMDAGKMRLGKNMHANIGLARHEKYQAYVTAEILPVMVSIVEQGIREGSFKVDYPTETAELVILLSQHLHDCEKSAGDDQQRKRKTKTAMALIEKALNAKEGTFFPAD